MKWTNAKKLLFVWSNGDGEVVEVDYLFVALIGNHERIIVFNVLVVKLFLRAVVRIHSENIVNVLRELIQIKAISFVCHDCLF